MGYGSNDIETRYERGERRPAVNVKCRGMFGSEKLRREWEARGYPESQIDKALEYCWESHVECFWENASSDAEELWGSRAKVSSDGRSGGWLVVDGIGSPEDWDAIAIGRWHRFEKWRTGDVAYFCSDEAIRESVEANEWLGETIAQANVGTSDEWLDAR